MSTIRPGTVLIGAALLGFLVFSSWDAAQRQAMIAQTRDQVQRVTRVLDEQTTPTGVYQREAAQAVHETDAWGRPLRVEYAQGGVAEVVRVRSAGPDGQYDTRDDITDQGMAMNLKGIGEGIKRNAEETAANTARGVVQGTLDGLKRALPHRNAPPHNN